MPKQGSEVAKVSDGCGICRTKPKGGSRDFVMHSVAGEELFLCRQHSKDWKEAERVLFNGFRQLHGLPPMPFYDRV